MDHELVTRDQWGARPTGVGPDRDGTPEGTVYIHHMASRWPTSPADEELLMRQTQARAIDVKGYTDMDYNVCVGPSGRVYVGRGLNVVPAATLGQNAFSRAVCAMGNTDLREPTPAQVDGLAWAIGLLQLAGELTARVVILGHKDSPTASTACPGRFLYPYLPTIRALVAAAALPDTPPDTGDDDDVKTSIIRAHGDFADWLCGPGYRSWIPTLDDRNGARFFGAQTQPNGDSFLIDPKHLGGLGGVIGQMPPGNRDGAGRLIG